MEMKAPLLIFLASIASAVTVSTGQYSNARTAVNTAETLLKHSNVTAAGFGKVGSYAVTGDIYAQPLYIPAVTVSAVVYNLLLVATAGNFLYAFDADTPGSAALWTVNLSPACTTTDDNFPSLQVGIIATPVVDTATNVIYFTACTGAGVWKMYAYTITDGASFHAPTTISGTVNSIAFDTTKQLFRPALLFANSKVYVAAGSYADLSTPYYGWAFSFNKTTLAIVDTWCTGCHSAVNKNGAVWMSGGGMAADAGGVYLMTGNGAYDGTNEFGESFVNLGSSLAVTDWATPSNYADLNTSDLDIGSGHVMLTGAFVMGGGKDGRFWLLNEGAMGHLQGGGGNPPIAQVWSPAAITTGLFSGSAFANSALFLSGVVNVPARFEFSGSVFTTTPTWTAADTGDTKFCAFAYSSNGATSATDILWASCSTDNGDVANVPGILRAYKASDGTSLYVSSARAADAVGNLAKFASPTVANGRVYVPSSSGRVNVFGLLVPSSTVTGLTKVQGLTIVR